MTPDPHDDAFMVFLLAIMVAVLLVEMARDLRKIRRLLEQQSADTTARLSRDGT